MVALCSIMGSLPAQAVTIRYDGVLRLPGSVHGIARPKAVSFENLAGEICVTDARSPALHVVNRQGVATFRTSRFAGLSTPSDACLDRDGSFVYIDRAEDGGSLTIRRLNLHGEPVEYAAASPHRDWTPTHLIICRDGGYLTLDTDAGRLVKHDPVTGGILWHRIFAGDESDRLFLGRPCEGPDGTIYVPGGELHAVLVLDQEGRQTGRFGEFGTGLGKMIFPVAVAVTPEGLVLVLDRMRHKILVHDAELRLLGEHGSIGAAPGQFYHPNGMAVADDGRILVSQGFEGRVQVFRLAGESQP